MNLKDILVHLDNSAASSARLDLAVTYARTHGARLRGLYLITHQYYEPSTIGEEAERDMVERNFHAACERAGIPGEWVFQDSTVIGSTVSDLVTLHAYYTDMVIIGQPDISSPVHNVPADLAERVVVSCGRPVLIVPYSGAFTTAAERVMIAWKPGRESVRAVHDALPHLVRATRVTIIEVVQEGRSSDGSLQNIREFLACHNVRASVDTICSGTIAIGDMLLNTICEHKTDLLVMGALAPNRRGTLELSPVARHVLKYLTTPLLLSH